jgi:hypothetical protein
LPFDESSAFNFTEVWPAMISPSFFPSLPQPVSSSLGKSGSLSVSADLNAVSVLLPARSTSPAATSVSKSRDWSLALILGIGGGIFALAAIFAVGFLLCRFRRSLAARVPSSDDAIPDLEFVESTLHETLVTFSDLVTVEDSHTAPLLHFASAQFPSGSPL